MNKADQITPKNCPICGEDNQCANASSSQPNKECWCMAKDVNFSESLLSKVPEADKNKSCICKACALKHQSLK